MNIGYFGSSFDPIHSGHLAVARAAAGACQLDRVLFVPTDAPPHKRRRPLTAFIHRYAMVALALAEARDQRFVPSLLEAPDSGKQFHYSIDTIRALKRQLKKNDRLFFLIGIDAFADIAKWRQPEPLLRACEFIVVSRPGYSLAQVADHLPEALRPRTIISRAPRRAGGVRTLHFRGVTIHLMDSVAVPASATDVRQRLRSVPRRPGWDRVLPRSVAAYIRKLHLYEVE